MDQFDRAADYDIRVVRTWLAYLEEYTGCAPQLEQKTILELGPGADLGTGLYLLTKGALSYNAMDVNDLAVSAPLAFYDVLFKRSDFSDIFKLRKYLLAVLEDSSDVLKFFRDKKFQIDLFIEKSSIDFVFSQASFEHFSDVQDTIRRLSIVAKHGAVLVAEIDLKTHSRWIRDRDPNNIYRYSDMFYNVFGFRGIPNRVRPYEYKMMLEKYGWENVQFFPLQMASGNEIAKMSPFLDRQFKEEKNEMKILSFFLCATKL